MMLIKLILIFLYYFIILFLILWVKIARPKPEPNMPKRIPRLEKGWRKLPDDYASIVPAILKVF